MRLGIAVALALVCVPALAAGCSSSSSSASSAEDDAKAHKGDAGAADALKKSLTETARGLTAVSETHSDLSYADAPILSTDTIDAKLVLAKLSRAANAIAAAHMVTAEPNISKLFVDTRKDDIADFCSNQAAIEADPGLKQKWKSLSDLLTTALTDRVHIRFQTEDPKESTSGGEIVTFVGGRANGRIVGFLLFQVET
jgi:hypothetical protein